VFSLLASIGIAMFAQRRHGKCGGKTTARLENVNLVFLSSKQNWAIHPHRVQILAVINRTPVMIGCLLEFDDGNLVPLDNLARKTMSISTTCIGKQWYHSFQSRNFRESGTSRSASP
jgi:hypothetical protein